MINATTAPATVSLIVSGPVDEARLDLPIAPPLAELLVELCGPYAGAPPSAVVVFASGLAEELDPAQSLAEAGVRSGWILQLFLETDVPEWGFPRRVKAPPVIAIPAPVPTPTPPPPADCSPAEPELSVPLATLAPAFVSTPLRSVPPTVGWPQMVPEAVSALPTAPSQSTLPSSTQCRLVAAHGGAGVTTIATALGIPEDGAGPVVVVTRTHVAGLLAAQQLAIEHLADGGGEPWECLALVAIADAPGPLPKPARDLYRLVSGAYPRSFLVPWIDRWRLGEAGLTENPRALNKFSSFLHTWSTTNQRRASC